MNLQYCRERLGRTSNYMTVSELLTHYPVDLTTVTPGANIIKLRDGRYKVEWRTQFSSDFFAHLLYNLLVMEGVRDA